nr:zinc finger CCCH domain-containing protein 48 [Tanacetum cinerariifolium]
KKPILLCSCKDSGVHIYDLPSFVERGRIFSRQDIQAIQVGPEGLFFTGDAAGVVTVWKPNVTVLCTVETPSTNLVRKRTFALLNMPSFSETTINCAK